MPFLYFLYNANQRPCDILLLIFNDGILEIIYLYSLRIVCLYPPITAVINLLGFFFNFFFYIYLFAEFGIVSVMGFFLVYGRTNELKTKRSSMKAKGLGFFFIFILFKLCHAGSKLTAGNYLVFRMMLFSLFF